MFSHSTKERVPRRDRPWPLIATGIAALIAVGTLAYWRLLSPPAPRVLNYTQITNDGADKITVLTIGSIQPPMVTDGSRVYFTEQQKGANGVIARVSVAGEPPLRSLIVSQRCRERNFTERV
jgi:hypothetical protein